MDLSPPIDPVRGSERPNKRLETTDFETTNFETTKQSARTSAADA